MGWSMAASWTLISLCIVVSAYAQWRVNQRSHQLMQHSDAQTLALCAKSDDSRMRALLAPLLVTRVVESASHKRVGMYLKRTVESLGFTTEWDRFSERTPYGNRTFRNLIATWDTLAPRRLVLACHYDSKILPGVEFIAATDSAVPCAIMLDVATTLAPLLASRYYKNIGLQLLFLDGEEAFVEWTASDSLYGARHLAAKWASQWYPSTYGSAFELSKEIDRMDVMMLLDLLGAANPRISNVVGHGANQLFSQLPIIEAEVKRLNCVGQLPQIFHAGLTYNAVEDDHVPFMHRGVPVLHLIAAPFPSVWHTPADNANALHYDTIRSLATIVRVFVARYLGVYP